MSLFAGIRFMYARYLRGRTLGQKIRNLWVIIQRDYLKKRIPSTFLVGITYRCMCNCSHCTVADYHHDGKELSTEEVKKLVLDAKDLGALTVSFFGGEPTLRKDLEELVAFTHKQGLTTGLFTNGILLKPENLDALKKAGLDLVRISMDSTNPGLHDENRKYPGAFEKAVNAIRYSVSIGLPVEISAYANKQNVHDGELEKIIDLGKKLGVSSVILFFTIRSGRADDASMMLTEEEKNKVRKLFDPPFVYNARESQKVPACTAARRTCYVSPFGEVQPCGSMPLYFGNIREESLKSIWERMSKHPMFEGEQEECMLRLEDFRKKHIETIPKDARFPHRVE